MPSPIESDVMTNSQLTSATSAVNSNVTEASAIPTNGMYESLQKSLQEVLSVEIRDKIENESSKILQAIGIFIGLFTFISANLTLFSRVKDLGSASIFTFLLFLLTSSYVLIMDLVITGWKNRFWFKFSISFVLLLFSAISLGYFSKEKSIPLNPIILSDEFRSEVEKICNERISNNTENIQTRFIKKDEFNDWKALNTTNNFDSKTKQESIKNCIKFSNNLQQLKTCFN